MSKAPNKYLILFLILFFAFSYRLLLMHMDLYPPEQPLGLQLFPPGADIGLHESVLQSITISGNTDFLWNYYQMGGGGSLTFPGYHIFLSYIISITGLPDYFAHSLVASFFSSLVVLGAFLVTRRVWKESAALVVAFLVAISRFDIEMLLWGGYPNAVTLMLIPLIYYIFLQKSKFSLGSFLVTTSLLSGTIFLTHSLSSAMFVGITFATVIVVSIFAKKIGVSRTNILIWLVPLFLGLIIVSPFLLKLVPAYLSGGMAANQQALLSTRVLPLELVLPLLVLFPLFFLFSKKRTGKFFTVQAFLLALWILIPTVLTQGFLIGLYIDYNRFLYFVVFPVIALIAIAIDHGSGFFSSVIATYRSLTKSSSPPEKSKITFVSRLMPQVTRRNLYSLFIVGFLLCSFFAVPVFLNPWQGLEISRFYQVYGMSTSGYQAIQWIQEQTPVGSIFVADAYYGWWLSGFAQRPTFSAVDPQYLTLEREFEPAVIARHLLDTNYVIDNGLIQVRADGGYIGRHNPLFLAKLNWTNFPFPFFHFNNSDIKVRLRIGEEVSSFNLSELTVKEMRNEISSDYTYAYILVKKGNKYFNYTNCITVYKDVGFAKMTIILESNSKDVYLDWVDFIIHITGEPLMAVGDSTVGLFDDGRKAVGQLIFTEKKPDVSLVTNETPSAYGLTYNLKSKSAAKIELLAGAFSVTDDRSVYQNADDKSDFLNGILTNNVDLYLNDRVNFPVSGSSLYVFDYLTALNTNEIDYVVCRDEVLPKFANDPAFTLEFIVGEPNDQVAVFKVKRDFKDVGSP